MGDRACRTESVMHRQWDARLRFRSKPHNITALWPEPNYTAWWQKHTYVKNLPRVITQQKTAGRLSYLNNYITTSYDYYYKDDDDDENCYDNANYEYINQITQTHACRSSVNTLWGQCGGLAVVTCDRKVGLNAGSDAAAQQPWAVVHTPSPRHRLFSIVKLSHFLMETGRLFSAFGLSNTNK